MFPGKEGTNRRIKRYLDIYNHRGKKCTPDFPYSLVLSVAVLGNIKFFFFSINANQLLSEQDAEGKRNNQGSVYRIAISCAAPEKSWPSAGQQLQRKRLSRFKSERETNSQTNKQRREKTRIYVELHIKSTFK